MKNERIVKKTEEGFIALTSVLILGAVIVVLGVSIFYASLTDQGISTAYQNSQEAAFLADFCLREGVLRLKENIDYVGGEEIEVGDMSCYIGPVEDVGSDGNTKKVSSLGRAGDQPHFSHSSQLVRYVIESSASDWKKAETEGELVNLWIAGDSLKLSSKKTEVTETTNSFYDWSYPNATILSGVEPTESGSLILEGRIPGWSELKEDGEPCGNNSECQSGNCQNSVCCAFDETCCTLDAHCLPDTCPTNCLRRDYFCDTITDHYCKYTESSCNCIGSCKCDGGVCTDPWNYGTTRINGSWDRNCDGTVTKRWTTIENCFANCGAGWETSVPYCGVSSTYYSCKWVQFLEGCIPLSGQTRTQECR